MRQRVLVVLLAAGLVVGLFPDPADAFAPPIPVAPPILGLCTTPWGVVACLGAVIIGGVAISEIFNPDDAGDDGLIGVGPSPEEDGVWCWQGPQSLSESLACQTNPRPHVSVDADWIEDIRPEWPAEGTGVWDNDNTLLFLQDDEETQPGSDYAHISHATMHRMTAGTIGISHDGVQPINGEGVAQSVVWEVAEGETACPHVTTYSAIYALTNCVLVTPVRLVGATAGFPTGNVAYGLLEGHQFTGTCSNADHVLSINGTSGSVFIEGCRHDTGTYDLLPDSTVPLDQYLVKICVVGGTALGTAGCAAEYHVPMDFAGNPQMQVGQTTAACRAENGTVTARVQYSETPVLLGEVQELPDLACLPGEVPISTSVAICASAASTTCHEVASWVLPTVDPETGTPLPEFDYSCVQLLATPSPCPMWVETWTGTDWVECDPALENCVDWWSHTNRETRFRCGWGGDYYSASQCVALRDFYNGETEDVITTNPTQPQPDPNTEGDPVQVGGPVPQPSSRPTRNWLSRIVDEWAAGATPDLMNSCWPSGWGLLNPLQWVMRPIMCALTFLFVPTTPLPVRVEQLHELALTRVGLGTMTEAGELLGGISSPSVGGSCGWGIDPIDVGVLETPAVDLILCPSEHGLSGTAATVRSWSLAAVGLWAAGMVYRWMGLGRAGEMEPDEPPNGNFT